MPWNKLKINKRNKLKSVKYKSYVMKKFKLRQRLRLITKNWTMDVKISSKKEGL